MYVTYYSLLTSLIIPRWTQPRLGQMVVCCASFEGVKISRYVLTFSYLLSAK